MKRRRVAKWGLTVAAAAFPLLCVVTMWWGLTVWTGTRYYGSIRLGALIVGSHPSAADQAAQVRVDFEERPRSWKWWLVVQRIGTAGAAAFIPLWMPALAAGLSAAPFWWTDIRDGRRRRRLGHCPQCGYDRAGLAAEIKCPECGTVPAAAAK